MQYLLNFGATFAKSDWQQPLDFLMVIIITIGSALYVYVLNPRPVKAPNQFAPPWEYYFPLNSQDKRFAVIALAIS